MKSIVIDLKKQNLHLFDSGLLLKTYQISSSKYGIGNLIDSNKTPLGRHIISEKMGGNSPLYGILKSGEFTGELAEEFLANTMDLITTRAIRLKGSEIQVNLGGKIDSERRGIWIHGTAAEKLIGTPSSHGCIRMKNSDVIDLFDQIEVGCDLNIVEDKGEIIPRSKVDRRQKDRRAKKLFADSRRRSQSRRLHERRK